MADLGMYMNKGTDDSGGSSAGSHNNGGIVGSTLAPKAYGIQFMPQPQSAPALMPNLSQGDPFATCFCYAWILSSISVVLCILPQALKVFAKSCCRAPSLSLVGYSGGTSQTYCLAITLSGRFSNLEFPCSLLIVISMLCCSSVRQLQPPAAALLCAGTRAASGQSSVICPAGPLPAAPHAFSHARALCSAAFCQLPSQPWFVTTPVHTVSTATVSAACKPVSAAAAIACISAAAVNTECWVGLRLGVRAGVYQPATWVPA